MKILVTGGAGFIGHNVVNQLEADGHECVIIDNLTTYGVIPPEEIVALWRERKPYYKASLLKLDLEKDDLNPTFESFRPEVVIHLAGFPRQNFVDENPILASNVMIGGTLRLLEASKKYGVRRFVYISSSMVYGDFRDNTHELTQTKPKGTYGIFKLTGEKLVQSYSDVMEYHIIRPSAVYGPRDMKNRVVMKFFLAAINNQPIIVNGQTERLDFTYVTDVAKGITLSAYTFNINRVYNLTRSSSRTLLEAAQLVQKIVGKGEIQIIDKDKSYPSRGRLNISSAMRELGYLPRINIEEGFQKTYEWIQNSLR